MSALGAWFSRARARKERRVAVEEALLGGRFGAYARYRLRYFALARGFSLVIHLAEFFFLAHAFSLAAFGSALAVSNVCMLAATFWWGALDVLRNRLRDRRPDQEAANEIGRWLSRARLLAACALSVPLLWAAARGEVGLLEAYVAVVCVRLAADLLLRTYYSGVYAHRRVYRPMAAVIAIEVTGIATLLILWSYLGPWSFPIGLALSVLLSRSLLFVYTRRAYRAMRLPQPRFQRLGGKAFSLREVSLAGAAGAATRFGSVIVLVLLARSRGHAGSLVQIAHLLTPMLAAVAAWPQVFYPDFKRLEDPAAAVLLRRFGRALARLALWIAAIAWLAAAAVLLGTFGRDTLGFLLATAPLFVAQSQLARQLLESFALRQYGRAVAGFAALGAALLLSLAASERLAAATSPVGAAIAFAAATLVAIAIVALWRLRPPRHPTRGRLRSPLLWLRALEEVEAPVCFGRIALAKSRGDQADAIASWLDARLGAAGATCIDRGRALYWFVPGAASPPEVTDPVELAIAGAGLVEDASSAPAASGGAAAQRARAEWLERPATESEASALPEECARRFPGAIVLDTAAPAAADLAPELRQTLWRAATLDSRGGRDRSADGYDVTAYAPRGEIALIFAVPKTASPDARSDWRSAVDQANWAS